jgi:hypothetical protein
MTDPRGRHAKQCPKRIPSHIRFLEDLTAEKTESAEKNREENKRESKSKSKSKSKKGLVAPSRFILYFSL